MGPIGSIIAVVIWVGTLIYLFWITSQRNMYRDQSNYLDRALDMQINEKAQLEAELREVQAEAIDLEMELEAKNQRMIELLVGPPPAAPKKKSTKPIVSKSKKGKK